MNKLITILLVAFLGLATTLTAQTMLSDQAFINDQITGAGVYQAESGKIYYFDGNLDVSWDVTIVGPDMDWIGTAVDPPVFVNLPDDAGAAQRFITMLAGGSLTLRNMVISGRTTNDNITSDIVLNEAGDLFISDNVAFVDYSGRALFTRSAGNITTIEMTNCIFINAQDLAYGPWGGDPIRLQAEPGPTLLENNTVVNHSRLTGNAGPGRDTFHMLHNTTVNGMKMALEPRAWVESITANNLFYNYDFLASKSDAIVYERYMLSWMYELDYPNRDSLAGYLGVNAFFKEQELLDWYANTGIDSNVTDVYTHEEELFAANDANILYTDDSEDFKLGYNYYGFDPGFTTHPGNTAEVVQLLNNFYVLPDRDLGWPDWRVQSPQTFDTLTTLPNPLQWPPEFDLSYSNEYLKTAGTDGLPMGDLNWFPADKATYEANRDMYIAALKDSILNATAIYSDTTQPTPLITPENVNAIEELDLATPNKFALGANYPNPFNPSTTLKFSLAKTANVSLKVYDLTGKLAMTVFNKKQTAGAYSVSIDMANFSSGVYFAVLNNGAQKLTRKMMLIK